MDKHPIDRALLESTWFYVPCCSRWLNCIELRPRRARYCPFVFVHLNMITLLTPCLIICLTIVTSSVRVICRQSLLSCCAEYRACTGVLEFGVLPAHRPTYLPLIYPCDPIGIFSDLCTESRYRNA